MTELEITVPMIPPSANHYVKHTRNGRHYITKEAIAFRAAIALFAKGQQIRFKFYAVEIYLCLGPKQKQDLDNCAKVVLDSLVKGSIIDSDAKITCLTLHKRRWDKPSTQITIWEGKKP